MGKFSRKTDAGSSEPGFFRGLFDPIRRVNLDRWLEDCGRFWWALIALNLSKTLFAARGRRGRWPCQSPSDSGRAWETTCEAKALWNNPARFRRVCPILKKAPDGRWVCSANTADVRPFWGRAAAWFGGAAIALSVAGTILYFVFLRIVG